MVDGAEAKVEDPKRIFPTDGAAALRAHLKTIGQSIPVFCEQHHLDRIQVQRALNGERQRISVNFALSIERATGGVVRCHQWETGATGTEG